MEGGTNGGTSHSPRMKILVNVLLRVAPVRIGETAKSAGRECTVEGHWWRDYVNNKDSQQIRMQRLHLPALGQLGEGQQHPMEVGQVVQHGWLEQIAQEKVVLASVQEQLDVLVAEKLKGGQNLDQQQSRASSKGGTHLSHLGFSMKVHVETGRVQEV